MQKTCTLCKKQKDVSEFRKHSKTKDKLQSICKTCAQEITFKSKNDKKIRHIKQLGGKCSHCNLTLENSHYSVFDFHHLNPSEKEFSWKKLRDLKEETVTKELSKCILLCANCHRIVHSRD